MPGNDAWASGTADPWAKALAEPPKQKKKDGGKRGGKTAASEPEGSVWGGFRPGEAKPDTIPANKVGRGGGGGGGGRKQHGGGGSKHAHASSGPDLPRKRINNTKVFGQLLEWKGRYGWIQPAHPIPHPKARQHGGKVYISVKDLVGRLLPGASCEFFVYEDDDGLGAENCMASDQPRAQGKSQGGKGRAPWSEGPSLGWTEGESWGPWDDGSWVLPPGKNFGSWDDWYAMGPMGKGFDKGDAPGPAKGEKGRGQAKGDGPGPAKGEKGRGQAKGDFEKGYGKSKWGAGSDRREGSGCGCMGKAAPARGALAARFSGRAGPEGPGVGPAEAAATSGAGELGSGPRAGRRDRGKGDKERPERPRGRKGERVRPGAEEDMTSAVSKGGVALWSTGLDAGAGEGRAEAPGMAPSGPDSAVKDREGTFQRDRDPRSKGTSAPDLEQRVPFSHLQALDTDYGMQVGGAFGFPASGGPASMPGTDAMATSHAVDMSLDAGRQGVGPLSTIGGFGGVGMSFGMLGLGTGFGGTAISPGAAGIALPNFASIGSFGLGGNLVPGVVVPHAEGIGLGFGGLEHGSAIRASGQGTYMSIAPGPSAGMGRGDEAGSSFPAMDPMGPFALGGDAWWTGQ